MDGYGVGEQPQFDGRMVDWKAAFGTGGFANEPPLLEGLLSLLSSGRVPG
jgi:hypothetical protein